MSRRLHSRLLKKRATLVCAGIMFCISVGAERGWANFQDRADESEGTVSDDEYRPEAVARTVADFIVWTPYFIRAKLHDYHIYPNGDRSYYESLGLAAGDVVIAIDGKGLTDSAQTSHLISDTVSATHPYQPAGPETHLWTISLEICRNTGLF